MSEIPIKPLPSEPCRRYMAERLRAIDSTHKEGFLWPEERRLIDYMIGIQNKIITKGHLLICDC